MRSMQWRLRILGTISAFAYRHRETKKNLCRGGRSQDLPNTDCVTSLMQRFGRRRVLPPRRLYVFMACCIATVNIGLCCTASCDEGATPLGSVSIPGCVPLRAEYSREQSAPPCVAKRSAAALCFGNLAVIAVEFATLELCKLGWHWSKEGSNVGLGKR